MSYRILFALVVAGILGAPVRTRAQLPELPFREGDPFPKIHLRTLNGGEPVSIADFRGKKVVLQIFASW